MIDYQIGFPIDSEDIKNPAYYLLNLGHSGQHLLIRWDKKDKCIPDDGELPQNNGSNKAFLHKPRFINDDYFLLFERFDPPRYGATLKALLNGQSDGAAAALVLANYKDFFVADFSQLKDRRKKPIILVSCEINFDDKLEKYRGLTLGVVTDIDQDRKTSLLKKWQAAVKASKEVGCALVLHEDDIKELPKGLQNKAKKLSKNIFKGLKQGEPILVEVDSKGIGDISKALGGRKNCFIDRSLLLRKYIRYSLLFITIWVLLSISISCIITMLHYYFRGYACNAASTFSSIISCTLHGYPKFSKNEIGILYNSGIYSYNEILQRLNNNMYEKSIMIKFRINSMNEFRSVNRSVKGINIHKYESGEINNILKRSGGYIFFENNNQPEFIIEDMVYIPEGKYYSPDGRTWSETKSFYIDKFEMTWNKYNVCVTDGACGTVANDDDYNKNILRDGINDPEFPVIFISWDQANQYCKWAGKRLPDQWEWEKAAIGTDRRVYPWGNTIDCAKAQYKDCGKNKPTKVGSYPSGISPYGVLDMAGNVGEWVFTNTLMREKFGCYWKGGSYMDQANSLQPLLNHSAPNVGFAYIGFRCAMNP